MTEIEYLDRPPPGDWFMLDVVPAKLRKVSSRHPADWIALMIDVDPDELKYCKREFAWLYVDMDEYGPDGTAPRKRFGSASRANIATKMPPSMLWKST